MFSLIIPVFNEEGAVQKTIEGVYASLAASPYPFEIIVVDDGSTDSTPDIIASLSLSHLRKIQHPVNRGNGAAIMSGMQQARGSIIGTVDADATYPLDAFPHLLLHMERSGAAMVVGARSLTRGNTPFPHRVAKYILTAYAEFLSGQKIPDINSGLRIVRRGLLQRWQNLYPERFSLHITLTLCALLHDEIVSYLPIPYYKRIGTSSMTEGWNGMKHFFLFLSLIARITRLCRSKTAAAKPIGIVATVDGRSL